jgi:hypothetical protein
MSNSFSIRGAIVDGWRVLRAHSSLVFRVMLTLFALEVAYAIVTRVLGGTLLGALAEVALVVLSIYIGAGFLVIALKLARGQDAHYRDLLPPSALVLNYFLASLLSGVIVLVPLVVLVLLLLGGRLGTWFGFALFMGGALCALLSAYFMLRYLFVKLAAVDGAGITGSLRASAAMTAGRKWHLVLLVLALVALNLVGLLCLVVGLVVTVPLSVLALARVYIKLKNGS